MRSFELLKIELMKVKRSKIFPLLFIAPFLVVISGIANLQSYFTPEYTNAWAAMFIQSALIYAYYLLPFSMIVVCAMLAGEENSNNGMLKMAALPVNRYALCIAKFFILSFFLLLEIIIFFAAFVIAGLAAVNKAGITETMPILYLLKWCIGLYFTMLPSLAAMWAVTVLFHTVLLSVGLNLILVIPSVLIANTPLWIVYPYCYSGYLVSCALHDFTTAGISTGFTLFPFVPCAVLVFSALFLISIMRFGKAKDY